MGKLNCEHYIYASAMFLKADTALAIPFLAIVGCLKVLYCQRWLRCFSVLARAYFCTTLFFCCCRFVTMAFVIMLPSTNLFYPLLCIWLILLVGFCVTAFELIRFYIKQKTTERLLPTDIACGIQQCS